MIYDEEAQKRGWTISEEDPGYATKTLKHGNCTIIINRPILTPEEQKKREEELCKNLELPLRDYVFRKEREAATAEKI